MEGLEQIQRASRRLDMLFRAGVWLTPALVAAFWYWVEQNPVLERQLPVGLDSGLPTLAKFWGFAASMLPGLVLMYIMTQLSHLFRLYHKGLFFTRANVAIFRRLGWCLLAWASADFLHFAGLGIVLTMHRPQGQRLLVLSLGSAQVLAALMGMVVVTVSRVMDEARKIEEEQALIV